MNRLVVLLFAFGFAASANGQGSVLFANQVGTTVNAPVFIYGTSAGPGPDYSAQLYLYGPDNSLTPIIPITTFSGSGPSSTEDRYWIPQTVDVSVQPGTDATFVVRAWRTSDGSYNANSFRGSSDPFTVTVGGGSLPPAYLTTLKSFSVGPLPEPSTIALGVFGAAVLFLRRPRRQ